MRRWGKWLVGGLVLALVVASVPILWIEVACKTPRDPAAKKRAALVTDSGYARRESDSYLTFPEWHIVYAYDEFAAVLKAGDESDFSYGRQVTEFWDNFCELSRVVTSRGRAPVDTRVMLYTIGWSFTAELATKGVYEKTFGRFFEWVRGPEKTEEDRFAAREMRAYAEFLRQTPWYEYPFGSRLVAFWQETPMRGGHLWRKLERRVVFTGEFGIKAIYGSVIGLASAKALGAADLTIQTVVVGLDAGDIPRDSSIKIVRRLGGGRTLIQTSRYQAYTDLVVELARRGRDIVEIAGNHRILITVVAPNEALPTLPETIELFDTPIQSKPGRRRVGLDVPVPHLAAAIRTLEKAGVTIEHIYDY
jgi:hypothetical protein